MTYTTVTPTQMVGRRVREIRTRRGWRAQDVADRCAEEGSARLSREIIANLEQGRRASLGIEEVLVLAHVLNVPPVLLMTPVGTDDRLQVTPNTALTPIVALTWITGEHVKIESKEDMALLAPLTLARRWIQQKIRLRDARLRADSEKYERASGALESTEEAMRDVGMPIEDLPAGSFAPIAGEE